MFFQRIKVKAVPMCLLSVCYAETLISESAADKYINQVTLQLWKGYCRTDICY